MRRVPRHSLLESFRPRRGVLGKISGQDPRLARIAEEVEPWLDDAHAGRRVAAEAVWSSLGKDHQVLLLRDRAGLILGACDYRELEDGTLYVNNLGSTGARGGVGRELMQAVAREAALRDVGVSLTAFKESRDFYIYIGMERDSRSLNSFRFSPEGARHFADHGRVQTQAEKRRARRTRPALSDLAQSAPPAQGAQRAPGMPEPDQHAVSALAVE